MASTTQVTEQGTPAGQSVYFRVQYTQHTWKYAAVNFRDLLAGNQALEDDQIQQEI